MSGDILARTLNRRDVKVEILGERAVALALDAAGTPPNPGRLNNLGHIVCKAADARGGGPGAISGCAKGVRRRARPALCRPLKSTAPCSDRGSD